MADQWWRDRQAAEGRKIEIMLSPDAWDLLVEDVARGDVTVAANVDAGEPDFIGSVAPGMNGRGEPLHAVEIRLTRSTGPIELPADEDVT